MMLALMRDLMNQAQLANNTFRMVNAYFNFSRLVRRCCSILSPMASLRGVKVHGPYYSNPLDQFYFKQIYNDEQRFAQVIINFASNGIKFTPKEGSVSILLKINWIRDLNMSA